MIEAVGLDIDKPPLLASRGGRVLAHHAVMYIVKGRGYFEDTSTKRQPVTPGTVFYLFPNKWHNFDPDPGTVWTESWVLFDGNQTEKRFGNLLPYERVIFPFGLEIALVEAFERLHELYFYRPIGYQEYGSYLLHQILVEFFMRAHRIHLRHANDAVQRAKGLMKQGLSGKTFDIQACASSARMSYEHFRKLFKKETGFSPNNYFLMLKMNRAKELLLKNHLPIKGIAAELGFEDPYHFSKLFKAKVGVSPNGYRNQNLGTLVS